MLRRTPLRRKSELKNRTPLKQRSSSPRAMSIERFRRQEANAVHARVRCQVPGCWEPGTDAHHTFGRDQDPWSSSRLALVLLCRGHHRKVTGEVGTGLDVQLRADLRVLAIRSVQLYINEQLRKKSPRLRVKWQDEGEVIVAAWEHALHVADLNGIEPPFFGPDRRKQ